MPDFPFENSEKTEASEAIVSGVIEKAIASGLIPISDSLYPDQRNIAVYGDPSKIRVAIAGTPRDVWVSVHNISDGLRGQLKEIQNGMYVPNIRIARGGNDAGAAAVEETRIGGSEGFAVTATKTNTCVYPAYTMKILENIPELQ